MIDGYLHWLAEVRNSSATTVSSYGSVLKHWREWCDEHDVLMARANRQHMEEFIRRPRQRRGTGGSGKPRTQRRDAAVLRVFYSWCVGEGWLRLDPAANLVGPKAPDTNPKPIPRDMWFDVWHSDMTPQLRTVIGLGTYAGLRRRELAELTCDKLDDGWINDFVRKGGGEHSVPWRSMMEVCCRKLDGHSSRWTSLWVDDMHDVARTLGPHLLLSPWSMQPSATTVNRQLEKHGIPWHPHQMRHSCATNLIKADVPLHLVQKYLNHRSMQTTLAYAAVYRDDLAEWLESH